MKALILLLCVRIVTTSTEEIPCDRKTYARRHDDKEYITDDLVDTLVDCLKTTSPTDVEINTLDLSDGSITHKAVTNLATQLLDNDTMENLYLSNNPGIMSTDRSA